MDSFETRLKQLNPDQLQAVKTIDGPLLVLAGPGTGKTTLLTMRVAYILEHTDTLPESILCLTFTESAQKTMQSRLVELLGQDAYRVQIHTFHSFSGWVIRSYPQYFEKFINSQTADDLTRYQIMLDIFERLPHYDPISSINEGNYLYLSDAMSRIGQLKQAAITPVGLQRICELDQKWVDSADKHIKIDLDEVKTISKSNLKAFAKLEKNLETLVGQSEIGRQCYLELRDALEEAHATEKVSTKPITSWKNSWLIKTAESGYGLKYSSTLKKLFSLVKVYRSYQKSLDTRGLTDFDDQLMLLLENMKAQPDLLAELQERFLYFMVDEYQDTNGVQQRILETLADSSVSDSQPNVMVVGDDDQAIYGFQGAYSSNVLDFLKRWQEVQTVTLTENYRSSPEIVSFSRSVIVQGKDRLENSYDYIDKELTTPNKSGAKVSILQADSQIESYQTVAACIRKDLSRGVKPEHITVLAPQHKYLERFVPYLTQHDIGVSYERRQDVLSEQHIHELVVLAEVVNSLANGNHKAANSLLPELLSYPWWNLKSEQVWQVSLDSYKQKSLWLPVMQASQDPAIVEIADWLVEQASSSLHTPLERMVDILSGHGEKRREAFCSPYYSYYFLEVTSNEELNYLLSSLLIIRRHIREFTGRDALKLDDFVSYCKLRMQSNLPIINDHPVTSKAQSVNLMTAYKSKGLEFDNVYLLDSHHTVWERPRGRSSLIVMPPHIARIRTEETDAENLRLFYVAITRAARQLTLSASMNDDSNNPILPIGWLQADTVLSLLDQRAIKDSDTKDVTSGLIFDWHERIATHVDADWRNRLSERLQKYRLSPTHLSTFLDVTGGGPRTFLINHLLRFPQGINPNIAFGNAMHHTMQYMHEQLSQDGSLPDKDSTTKFFVADLAQYGIGDIEQSKQRTRGEYALDTLYKHGLDIFRTNGQISEVDLSADEIIIGKARVTGKIDLLDTDRRVIRDYKTGKPVSAWPKDGAKSYDALKMYRYRQQLLFYKLMMDRSEKNKEYPCTAAELVFLESGDHTSLQTLAFEYDKTEQERLENLIQAVWHKIMLLDLPDTTKYKPDITGVKQFEEDLLNGN